MSTLYGLHVSPYTERARWALDHHRVEYKYHEHLPLLGELLLRRKVRHSGRKATVPALDTGDRVIPDSIEIARYADDIGKGSRLFPEAHDAAIRDWCDGANQLMDVARAWVLANLAASREAQKEALPSFTPGFARPLLAPMSRQAALFLEKKHTTPKDIESRVDDTVRPWLTRVREAKGDKPYLLDAFTFADVVICTMLAAVRPRAAARLGPATREVWTHASLERDFGDLLEWRDAIYAKHRS